MASLIDSVSDYNYIVSSYFQSNGYSNYNLGKPLENTTYFKKDSSTLYVIQQVIKAFDAYHLRVDTFEKNNGKSEHEYLMKLSNDNFRAFSFGNSKSPTTSKTEVERRKKEWQNAAESKTMLNQKQLLVFLSI